MFPFHGACDCVLSDNCPSVSIESVAVGHIMLVYPALDKFIFVIIMMWDGPVLQGVWSGKVRNEIGVLYVTVVDAILKGEDIGIGPRRRSCTQSKDQNNVRTNLILPL